MERTTGLLELPRLLAETLAWTATAAGIALAIAIIGFRARRPRTQRPSRTPLEARPGT